MLWRGEAQQRMVDLFSYYGGTTSDIQWGLNLVKAHDPETMMKECDSLLVFLTRHARISNPEWIENQDFDRLHRLVSAVEDMAKAEKGEKPNDSYELDRDRPLGS